MTGNNMTMPLKICAAAVCLLLFSAAARGAAAENDGQEAAAPRTEEFTHGPVTVRISASPGRVDPAKNILLSISAMSPDSVKVELPEPAGRLEGFVISDSYTSESSGPDGRTVTKTVRLTPQVAQEYRLAPMAVVYTDNSKSPPVPDWFATKPVVFDTVFRGKLQPDAGIGGKFNPVWIYPPFSTVLIYLLAAAAACLAAILLYKLTKKVKRHIRLMRMSPRERALEELAELARKDLVAKGLVKEFYLELTLIVRRFIERLYRLRAPELTTEEFLAAAGSDTRFEAGVVGKLKAFLEAADLVKFAALRPGPAVIDKALKTAREYITVDTGPAAAKPESEE